MHATTQPLELHILGYDVPLAPRPAARAFVAEVAEHARRAPGVARRSSWPSWRVDGDRARSSPSRPAGRSSGPPRRSSGAC